MNDAPIRVQVLWGISTHKCLSCNKRGEWSGQEPPTEEQMRVCPACGNGPLVALTSEERKEDAQRTISADS